MVQEETAPATVNGIGATKKTTVSPFIGFNGRCNEAIEFYKNCLGGELHVTRWQDSPMADQCPAGQEHHLLHAALVNKEKDFVIMGSDMTSPAGHVHGNNMSICIDCSSDDEINSYYSNLGRGGTVLDPLGQKFWGDKFGVIRDKFGITWMLNYDPSDCV